MGIEVDEVSKNAMGGTELMKYALQERMDPALLEKFQIIPSRVRELDESKVRILWLHDLPGDPESDHLANNGWEKFHRLVFVSNWQMQGYIQKYNIPWSRCIVLQNAIVPIPEHDKPPVEDKVKIIYTSTPHRGLNILYAAFKKLCETHDNIELDVYSSFKLYGWEQRDEQFKELFDALKGHPNVNYYGAVSNEKIREALQHSHIFALPSTWPETSCLCLIEAMSAANICVHSNLAALPETAANWTLMYQFHEDLSEHAGIFSNALNTAIHIAKNKINMNRVMNQKLYTDENYNWDTRASQWTALLESMQDFHTEFPKPKFVYRT